jgi:predicted nucleic acid-binding protein
MPVVLDASVTLAWLFDDEHDFDRIAAGSLQIVERDGALVPTIWVLEVANGLRNGERRGRFEQREVARFTNRISVLSIDVDDIDRDYAFGPLLAVARQYNLSVYDATYLDLAIREGLPIATLDRALERAAHEAGVELLA